MRSFHRNTLPRGLIVTLALAFPAWAQAPRDDRDSSLIDTVTDSVSRGLSFFGQKSETLLSPTLGPLSDRDPNDMTGLYEAPARRVEETRPIRPNGRILIGNEFGEIRVTAWENPVVQIIAEIRVGAEAPDVAAEVQEAIAIQVLGDEERLEIRKQLPDMRELGKVVTVVNYALQVPAGVAVTCENNWGNTVVVGLTGGLTVLSRYGGVDLRQLAGPVEVRAVGEFPLKVYGLREGGAFTLQRSIAEFGAIAGTVKIDSFMGALTLRELSPTANVSITSDSGPVHWFVPENMRPDIAVTARFGDVVSDIPLDRAARDGFIVARGANPDATQRVQISNLFDNVTIHQEGLQQETVAPAEAGAPLVATLQQEADVPPGTEVVVEAIIGDIRIEGIDEGRLSVEGQQHLRILDPGLNADAARQGLGLSLEQLVDRLRIKTSAREDLGGLGVTYHRIDLVIRCPRATPIRVSAHNGRTTVTGMTGGVVIEQGEGAITVEGCTGGVDVTNRKGDVRIYDCAGAVKASAAHGQLETRSIDGDQALSCEDGKTVIEIPHGAVVARHRVGNVFILADDGVLGDYDVQVTQGDINIAVPTDTTDATITATTRNGGTVRASQRIPLTGTKTGNEENFTGRLNNGTRRVLLQTTTGNILID